MQKDKVSSLDLRWFDGALMTAAIDHPDLIDDFSRLNRFICELDGVSEYKSSSENDGCLFFKYDGKLCTSRFYEPDLIELDFDFRDIQSDEDLDIVIRLLKKVSSNLKKKIDVHPEGGDPTLFIVDGTHVDFVGIKRDS